MRLRARVLSPSGPDEVAWLDDALVEVDARGRLAEVGPWDGGRADLDIRPGILTPGFVDAHVHFPQHRIVGRASGPLLPWLERTTFPEEARFADPGHAARVARQFLAALPAAGTTFAVVYGSVHATACDLLLTEADRRGLKLRAGPVLMDEGAIPELHIAADEAIGALDALADRWHGHDGRLEVACIPRFALSCSAGLLARAGDLARHRDLWVTTHLAETVDECAEVRRRFAARDYLSVYEDAGLVHGRTLLAHCLHLDDDAWRRLADADAVVAHCPDSNDFLGSGGMDLGRVLDGGIPWALGTDVAAGRSLRVPRIGASAHDNALRHQRRLSPARWLWAGTRGGALALHREETGALEPGLDADMVWHDVPPWVDDADSAMAAILFDHDAPPPRGTWVRGRRVWDRDQVWRHGGVWPWDVDA